MGHLTGREGEAEQTRQTSLSSFRLGWLTSPLTVSISAALAL